MTLNELSEKLDISKSNLIKVSNQLAKFSFIETSQGRAGGVRIKPETGLITLDKIILKTEESFQIAECFGKSKCGCTFLKNCFLQISLKKALSAFLESLGHSTLNDVTPVRKDPA